MEATQPRLPQTLLRRLVATIVTEYVANHPVPVDRLAELLAATAQALAACITPPAVPVALSVSPERIACLECGWTGKVIRLHLRRAHGLTIAAYLARWHLPPDHPVTAPDYSRRRSALAREIGLGRRGR
jgi:predicted transcriptional regulator